MYKSFIFSILLFSLSYSAYSQLKYIAIADKDEFFDKEKNQTIYPNLGIRKDACLNLFSEKDTIYSIQNLPNGYATLQYEIFNNKFLVITFVNSLQITHSSPMYIVRKDMHIIDLASPKVIFHVDIGGRQIAENDKLFDVFTRSGKMIYVIDKINIEHLVLELRGNDKTRHKYRLLKVE